VNLCCPPQQEDELHHGVLTESKHPCLLAQRPLIVPISFKQVIAQIVQWLENLFKSLLNAMVEGLILEGSSSPRIVGYEESETEEKRPPSPSEYEFLVERPVEAGVPYKPTYREQIKPPARPRVSMSRILITLCLVGLAASTMYMTYEVLDIQNKLSSEKQKSQQLGDRVRELNATISSLQTKSIVSTAFARWLSNATIVCKDVFLPHKPKVEMKFEGVEKDKGYGIMLNHWNDFNMKVTYAITNSFGTTVHSGTLPVGSRRTFELSEKNFTKEFTVDRYLLIVSATIGEPASSVASVAKHFEVQKDLIPPLIEWLDKDYVGDMLTIKARITDRESGLDYARILYRFVWIVGTARTTHEDHKDMKELQAGVYSFSFADIRPPSDLRKANITIYHIEAKDRAGNVAYSEPVIYLWPARSSSLPEFAGMSLAMLISPAEAYQQNWGSKHGSYGFRCVD